MESKQPIRIRLTIYIVLILLGFLMAGCAHRSYFFPLEKHTDLRFQLTGEITAFAIFWLSLALQPFVKRSLRALPIPHTMSLPLRRIVYGLRSVVDNSVFWTWMVTAQWRKNFSGQKFHPSWLLENLLMWIATAFFIGLVAGDHFSIQEDEEQTA